jgi:hypothetical protein
MQVRCGSRDVSRTQYNGLTCPIIPRQHEPPFERLGDGCVTVRCRARGLAHSLTRIPVLLPVRTDK